MKVLKVKHFLINVIVWRPKGYKKTFFLIRHYFKRMDQVISANNCLTLGYKEKCPHISCRFVIR